MPVPAWPCRCCSTFHQDHGARLGEMEEACPAPTLPCVRAGSSGLFPTPLLHSFLEN